MLHNSRPLVLGPRSLLLGGMLGVFCSVLLSATDVFAADSSGPDTVQWEPQEIRLTAKGTHPSQ